VTEEKLSLSRLIIDIKSFIYQGLFREIFYQKKIGPNTEIRKLFVKHGLVER
jgi:hypothetical protein